MGGAASSEPNNDDNKGNDKKDALISELGFMDGFERAGSSNNDIVENDNDEKKEQVSNNNNSKESAKEKVLDPAAKRLAMRKAREEKVAKARIRYFERNGIPLESVSW